MKEVFYVYLNNLYWLNIEYGVEKEIFVDSSAYKEEDICFYNYKDKLYVSSLTEYVMERRRAYIAYVRSDGDYELPNIKYQTNDPSEINKLLYVLSIPNYETKITELMNMMKDEKTLSLVDNK